MLTAKTPLRSIVSRPSAPRPTQTRTSGGSSETDENAFAVMPYAWSSPRVVITFTPVAKIPTAFRKSLPVKFCGFNAGFATSVAMAGL